MENHFEGKKFLPCTFNQYTRIYRFFNAINEIQDSIEKPVWKDILMSSSNKDGSSKYQCDKCVKICCAGKQLKTHVGAEHDVTGNDCLFCGEIFPLKHHLLRHIGARKPVKCSFFEKVLCNQIIRNKHEERQHEKELNEMLNEYCLFCLRF